MVAILSARIGESIALLQLLQKKGLDDIDKRGVCDMLGIQLQTIYPDCYYRTTS